MLQNDLRKFTKYCLTENSVCPRRKRALSYFSDINNMYAYLQVSNLTFTLLLVVAAQFLLFQPSDFTRVIFLLVLYFVCVVLYSYLRNFGLLRLFAASINECIAENFAVLLSPYHNGPTKNSEKVKHRQNMFQG